MKKTITGIVTLLLTVSMLLTAAACGGDDASGDNGDVTTIRVDLHGWTPTVSSTSTPGSTAYNSPKEIAREFEELYDNKVKIEWVRDKNLTASAEDVSQYFALAIENGTCPSIAFTWGTTYQDRGWYIDLTEYLEEENSYETAEDLQGKPWKESFEDYIWTLSAIRTYDDKIVAIPLTLFAGSASTILYNTAKMAEYGLIENGNPTTIDDYELGIDEPFDWNTYLSVVEQAVSENKKYLVDATSYPYTANSWLKQFDLGPAYMSYVLNYEDPVAGKADKDGDGMLSGQEMLQAVVDGFFDPVTKPYAKELLDSEKEYMQLVDEENADASEWEKGNAVVKFDGSWVYTPEKNTNRSFNWEMVPAPVQDDSDYTRDYVEWVSFEEAQPGVDLYLNIMRPGVTVDGTVDGEIDEDKLFYSVEFMKYLTTREANSAMIDEMNTSIGAVKGCTLPAWLEDSAYINCQFAKTESANGWPGGFVTEISTQMDTLFSQWVSGTYDGDFYAEWNRLQVEGARKMAESLGITLE